MKTTGLTGTGCRSGGECRKDPTLPHQSGVSLHGVAVAASVVLALAGVLAGCGTRRAETQNKNFFTSGSREADQRASQRMAKEEQLAGSGEGAGEKGVKKAKVAGATGSGGGGAAVEGQPAQAQGKLALFDRLGGEKGLTALVDDFIPRALQDPRVNWSRQGVTRATVFHHNRAESWNASTQNVAILKQHLVEFLALATGGPAHYGGKEMKNAHSGMHISNPEFDAAVGDLKASLDKLQIANKEQKELLAIIESTRPEIVTEK